MKKLLVFLTAALMTVALAACGGSDDGGSASGSDLKLADGGKTEFTIVYPEGASQEVADAADYLAEKLGEALGVSFKVSEDMAIGSGEGKSEILIGKTDRQESADAFERMTYCGDYIVMANGTKLVVQSMLDGEYTAAIDAFAAYVSQGNTTIEAGYELKGSSETFLKNLPAFSGGELKGSYDCGDDEMMVMYNADEAAYTAYLTNLESNGFTKYSDNQLDNNKFAVYTNQTSQTAVYIMCLPALNNVRISAGPIGYLPEVAAPQITASVTPSMTMLGLEGYETTGSPNQIGMSFIFQISDGHFVIFDGGHSDQVAVDNMWNKLTELAPDPANITIEAWFLTHGHGDHIGCFHKFSEQHAGDVTLKLLVSNFPAQFEFDNASEAVRDARERTQGDVAKYEGCRQMKLHMGQVVYAGDAKITCYGSFEMVAPQSLDYFNNSSINCMVELGGQRINMLADCGPLQSPVLTQLYAGGFLKADVCQIGHHGYMGMTSECYKLIAPDYGFWPGGSSSFEKYKEENYNVWVVNHVKKLWVAEDQIYTEQLPISY